MCNQDIRQEIVGEGIKYWQVADKLGMYDGNFSRKLRKELPAAEKEKIRAIIKELQAEKE